MGGWNSGRNNRGAGRCEAWHRVELSWLRKHDYLRPGRSCRIWWHMRGEETGAIAYYAFEHHAELRYCCNGENVIQRISYRYTPTNFGGRRLHFECPRCNRSCDVLYGGRRFYCRKCWRLTYASQYDDWWERCRNRAEKIRTKLGKPGFITPDEAEDFPDKPKWMRWRTYHPLEAEDDRLMAMYQGGFGLMVAKFMDRWGGGRKSAKG